MFLAVKILRKIGFLAVKWVFLTDPSWEMKLIPHILASSEEQIMLMYYYIASFSLGAPVILCISCVLFLMTNKTKGCINLNR